MPRNSSGTYSLYTPGNPTVPSTVITTTWANNTLSDLATAMTDSLSRSGQGGMSAPLQLAAGAIGTPGMSWTAEPTSGWYRSGAGDFRFSISAADQLTLTATGITAAKQILIGAATGGFQGNGTINATAVYDDGVLLANAAGANPSASVGLTAVDGAASTFMRSDGAPALSVAIVPTWTGVHTFGNALVRQTAANPTFRFTDTTASSNAKVWDTTFASGSYFLTTTNDAENAAHNVLKFDRSGITLTAMTFGNATDNPTYFFLGTGAATFGGDVSFTLSSVAYPVGYRSIPRSTTTTTLVAADNGKCVAVSANIAIPASVFSAGDCIAIYNDSGSSVNVTIAAGTLRLAGSASTGTRALAARGSATFWFNVGGATPEVIGSGPGLT